MELPFDEAQFLEVFRQYHAAIGPMPIVLNLMALAALVVALLRPPRGDRTAPLLLGLIWIWTGAVYHMGTFTAVNPAAWGFGTLFAVEGIALVWVGLAGRLRFRWRGDAASWVGALFVLYALVLYPLLGWWMGHGYPGGPSFGAPCPVTIFTFGMLLFARGGNALWGVAIIPFLWSLVGFTAALKLGIVEDFGLLAAGILGTAIILFITARRRGGGAASREG